MSESLMDAALHADAGNPSRREQILRAAAQRFAERGSRDVGVDDVGAAVGVTGPAIYRHCAGKDAMLAEALLRASEPLLACGTELAAALRLSEVPPAPSSTQDVSTMVTTEPLTALAYSASCSDFGPPV